MTIDEFCGILAAFQRVTGVPFRHYVYSEPVSAPCLVYYEMDGDSVHADSKNVYDDVYIRAELYVTPDDTETPYYFESLLKDSGLTYDKDRAWIEERHEVMMIYDIAL